MVGCLLREIDRSWQNIGKSRTRWSRFSRKSNQLVAAGGIVEVYLDIGCFILPKKWGNRALSAIKNCLYPNRIVGRFFPEVARLADFHPILFPSAVSTFAGHRQQEIPWRYDTPYQGMFTTSWFSGELWSRHFGFTAHNVKDYLEIGSFEGRSTLFAASVFPKCRLTCIDTFAGGSEHCDEHVSGLEARFLKNIEPIKDRVRILKGLSHIQLVKLSESKDSFDFIFIDGSHYHRHVMMDTLLAWPMLRIGGIMVWDDYLWRHSPFKGRNPKSAIDHFLRIYKPDYKVIFASSQVAIQKIFDENV